MIDIISKFCIRDPVTKTEQWLQANKMQIIFVGLLPFHMKSINFDFDHFRLFPSSPHKFLQNESQTFEIESNINRISNINQSLFESSKSQTFTR